MGSVHSWNPWTPWNLWEPWFCKMVGQIRPGHLATCSIEKRMFRMDLSKSHCPQSRSSRRTPMPNIATILRDEILRLARKEVRSELESLKKASARYRSEIAALKRSLSDLEKRQSRLESGKPQRTPKAENASHQGTTLRYSAKGLTKMRTRLGLSGVDLGRLLGVSTQTIYNWESEKSRPRADKLMRLFELRSTGKRSIRALLLATSNSVAAKEE